MDERFRQTFRLQLTIGVALLLTAAVAAVAWLLFPDISPEELQVCRQSGKFISLYQGELLPEPRERNTFLLALFASPFLAGAAIWIVRRREFLPATPLTSALLAGAWAFFAEAMLFGHGLWIEDFASNAFRHPGYLISSILTGLVAGYLLGRRVLRGNGWIYWASLLFPIAGVLFCILYPEQFIIQMWTFHFEPICYAVSRAVSGGFENHLYGLYPRFLAPLFHLIGLSVFKLSLVMSLLHVLTFAMVLRAFWLWSRNRLLTPLFSLILAYLGGIWCFFRLKEFDPYYEYHPIRSLFPAAALLGAAFYCRLPEERKNVGALFAGLLAGCAVCWNLDSGIPVAGAFFCLIALRAIADRGNRRKWILLFLFTASLIFTLAAWWVLFSLQQGAPLAILPLIKYQRLFLQEGVNLLPMQPFPAAWALILAVYLAAMTQGIRAVFLPHLQTPAAQRKAQWMFFTAILGAGLFAYYQGRSHTYNLAPVSYPAFLLLFVWLDDQLRTARCRKLERAAALLAAWPALLLSGLVVISIALGGNRIVINLHYFLTNCFFHDAEDSLLKQHAAFIRSVAQGRPVNIYGRNQGLYYAETGLPAAIADFSQIELFLAEDIARVREALKNSDAPLILAPGLGMGFDLDLEFVEKNFVWIKASPDGMLHYFERRRERSPERR